MGRAPHENPVRRNSRVGPLLLPAGGRPGEAPPWPLPGVQSRTETTAWKQLWASPQAVAWENLGWTRTVARYCRIMVAAEKPDATAAIMAQASSLEDRLGLTPRSMRLLLWKIAPDEVADKRDDKPASVRGRLRAVESA